jgi:hypothetical protein
MDMDSKISNFSKINGIIKGYSGRNVSENVQLRLHKITAKNALLFGSKTWTVRNKNKEIGGLTNEISLCIGGIFKKGSYYKLHSKKSTLGNQLQERY